MSTLQQAATLADEFVLTHRSVLAKRDPPREVFSEVQSVAAWG